MKVFLSLLVLVASACCAPTTVVPSTPVTPVHNDWPHFHRQVQVQVFQLESSLHELHKRVNEKVSKEDVVLLHVIVKRDQAMVETILKEVEAEAQKNLEENEKAFISETKTFLNHVSKQLTKVEETLTGTEHKATTPSAFEADTVSTTVKSKDDFKTFEAHTKLSLSHIETSVGHIEKDEVKNRTPEQVEKLKAQVEKDLVELEKLEKKVTAETEKSLTDEHKAFVTKSADAIKALKARLVAAQEKVGHIVPGTAKTSKHSATTPTSVTSKTAKQSSSTAAYYAETKTPATVAPLAWVAFHDHVRSTVDALELTVFNVNYDVTLHPEKAASHLAQVEKALKSVADLEKLINNENTKNLNEKEKTFTKTMLAVVQTLEKQFRELEAKAKGTTGVTSSTAASTTPSGSTKHASGTTKHSSTTKHATAKTAKQSATTAAFEAETKTPATVAPLAWVTFHDHVRHSVDALELIFFSLSQASTLHPEKAASQLPKIEKALQSVADLEKLINNENTKNLNEKEKTFTKTMLAVVQTLEKDFRGLEAKAKGATGVTSSTPAPTTPSGSTKHATATAKTTKHSATTSSSSTKNGL